jgi:amino acid adenylation domain-containing protein
MSESQSAYEGIAVIGMSGRFPGAETVEEFWANLVAGKESISFFSDAELADSGINGTAVRSRGQYVPARGVLKDADCFDAAFFGVHPKEAEVMDPQQRVFLEVCWAALESAGYPPNRMTGAVGVFGGATFNTYFLHAIHPRPDLVELVGSDAVMLGNEKDYLTSRVAYKLGLKGPALSVSTACSTSLVAVVQACQSLLTYQCDTALAGGVSVNVPQKRGYYHEEGNIASADGHTRTFDAKSSGTVFSNGVAVVILKRLEDAVKDRDNIYAVIKGAALNNDGSQRVSFGAPGVEGQSEVIALAHALAGVDPETISYVEAHGTATPLGDPIEVAALTKAFRMGSEAKQFCALGSVKTNIGHLDAASGVTGLIKTVLALHHKQIPASLHFTHPNPKLDLEDSPFFVNSTLRSWETKPGIPRRAGVSSFGTGGTNAHVVVEEAPQLELSGQSRPWQLLTLSAKTVDALDRATDNLSAHLKQTVCRDNPVTAARLLADAAFTLQTGRAEFIHRRIVVCSDAAGGADVLDSREPKRVFTHQQVLREPPVVFMFPGQGSQYVGMGASLYSTEPVFRSEVDRCVDLLKPVLGLDLRSIMFPVSGSEAEAERLLVETRFTQPALFVIEYALAKLWMSWGVQPAAMIGHSVGEYVAGCLAGVFTLQDALTLVARRGALVQAQPGGAMLAVRLPEKELASRLNGTLSIAAINSPGLCVVSGPSEPIGVLEVKLNRQGVMTRRLQTSHAFHSAMMEPVLGPFTELLRQVSLGEPRIPYVSNVTARWITPAEARQPEYWANHVRDTVRFADGIAELVKDPKRVLLEVGPGHSLSQAARQHPDKSADQIVLTSLQLIGNDEPRGVLESLGRLWMSGVRVDWPAFYANEQRRRIALPTYPFERKRYWPASMPAVQGLPAASSVVIESATAPIALDAVQVVTETADAGAPDTHEVVPRRERLLIAARALLQELSGYDFSNIDSSADLLELGLDSLLLTQAATLFQRKFGVSITFRQLMEELSSLDAIAEHLNAKLPPESSSSAQLTAKPAQPIAAVSGGTASASPRQAPATGEIKSHGPFKPIVRGADLALNSKQSQALEEWIARYTRRTPGSKKLAAENREVLADPRSVSGFKQLWKEMVYPIAINRSEGSKVWDVDGNEYLDFVMGFGASLFGHRPPFVVDAVREQLKQGFEVGPIHPLAGEVAWMIREFTGMQRVGFTNTGSEAVLAATRVARTVTGRDKIAVFAGAYHGIFDEVLFRPLTINGETRTAPIAPGIPESALAEVIVLEYGNPHSIEIIRSRGAEIAAVLVEPVQSRRLDLQPREFMHELRRVTEETGSALIFDEVVTGFRLHPGGAQAYFGVRADLATYGKVIGGGLPIGAVTGNAKFMDALDGGMWKYGDSSFPEVGVTFFAGTFVRHTLVLAAAKAVLTHLKERGPELQSGLESRTSKLADQLREVIREFQAPYQVTQFTSLMQIAFPHEQKFAGLIFYLLRERGIHIWENRAFVITTAHSEADFERLIRAFRESLAEMQSCGFLSASTAAARPASSGEGSSQTEHGGTFPLTEAQKEIWLAAQMGGQAAVAYNESLSLKFRGPFDVDVFRAAAQRVARRHPILMASISVDGQSQRVELDLSLDVPVLDFSGLAESEKDRELEALIEKEVSEPFNLATGPLLRVRIARMSSDYHVVIWTAHHIVCDGWSGGIIVNDLARIYSALKKGIAPELKTPTSFRSYAVEAQFNDSAVKTAVEYWQQQFADLPPALDIPTDHPRTMVRSAKASTAKHEFGVSIHQSLKQTAKQQRTTMVVLLMAGLKTLLYKLTGQTDLVVGMGVAGQAVSGNTDLVGHCLNLLPFRTHLQPDATFQQNLSEIRKSVLDGFDHHECTIGGILQHLKVPRGTGRPPLIEVIFNVDRDLADTDFFGLEFSCERNPKRALHFDLFFNFVEGQKGLLLECDYNADLFDASTIERWMRHYQTALEGIARNPSEPLGRIPVLTEPEYQELMFARNQPGREFEAKETLHEWFERQVEESPNAVAVTFEGANLTYAELNRRSNQVAHHLRKLGVGPDVLVGLYVDRSTDIFVGILGILKAGGAYLPLDPVYPKERLAFMLDDAKVPVLLTQRLIASELPAIEAKILCFDTDRKLFDGEADTNPNGVSTPDNLAYVIYTSGSTGKPKGSLISHYNVVRLMRATENWFHFNQSDIWTFFHSHAFDFSVWEMWGALLYGGRSVVVPYLKSRSPKEFYELLVAERVTVLNQTPSAFKQLVHFESTSDSSNSLALRYVIFGGEALEMQSLKPWFDRHGDKLPQLVNMYGITETTVHVTYRALSSSDLESSSVIGIPIPDLQVYILDPYQQPAPIGVTGEIWVGGAGVARGYLGRDELTRQKFQPDTFSNRARGLVYRSGDLARYLPGRDIEYIGRIDDQVKIRGFRIELGEIEAVLSRHGSVRQCVVIVKIEGSGDKVLIAYFESREGINPTVSDLRAHLKNELPDYMVPSIFVPVEKMPLTPNGKIDRKALPSSEGRRMESQKESVAPRDELEQVLCRIWSKILRVERVGLNDNFFELGGHSLLAVRIIGEIEKLFKRRLPLATLLQAPTVGELAEVLRSEDWKPSWSSLVPIRPGGSKPPLFLMHSHGGNVLEYLPLANYFDADQPIYALQAQGMDGQIVPNRTLEQMAALYLEEVKSLQPEGPYFLGGFCFGGLMALEAAQQLTAKGEEVALVVMIQTTHPSYVHFKPDLSPIHSFWSRVSKRMNLERENLRFRGASYLQERSRRMLEVATARTAIGIDKLRGNGHSRLETASMTYILECLGIEHDRAFENYVPSPYKGDVLLFRANRQLPGLDDPNLGWSDIIQGNHSVYEVPGHQQNMLVEPNLSRLAEELKSRLGAAQRRYGSKLERRRG